jgi:hypothetical protein
LGFIGFAFISINIREGGGIYDHVGLEGTYLFLDLIPDRDVQCLNIRCIRYGIREEQILGRLVDLLQRVSQLP